MIRCQVGIPHGGLNVPMTHKFLHRRKVHARHHKVVYKGVHYIYRKAKFRAKKYLTLRSADSIIELIFHNVLKIYKPILKVKNNRRRKYIMPKITAHIYHEGGVPLGGIGTGSIEIRTDGYFHDWQIFNIGHWAPSQPECCRVEGPDMTPAALAFYIRTSADNGEPLVRRLGIRTDQHDLYAHSWCKNVQAIEFEGTYPIANLNYIDSDLPVSVSATMFSPFIPHDSRASGTPGIHIVFQIKNRYSEPVDVSITGTLDNPLAWGARDRKLTNTITHTDEATFLTMRTAAEAACKATIGSIGLSISGGENSWVAGDFRRYFRSGCPLLTSDLGRTLESLLYEFRSSGRLLNSEGTQSPIGLLNCGEDDIDSLSESQKLGILSNLRQYAVFEGMYRRIVKVNPDLLKTPDGISAFLKGMHNSLNIVAGRDRDRDTWGDGGLCSSLVLQPKETKEIRFTLGWYFPNHYSAKGPILGHMYEHWFADAEDVNRFLVSNFDEHRRVTCGFADALYDTTLPPEFADAWSAHLSTLAKCTWWTKAGDFAVWEGLGCCGFHTTDVSYYGSFSILALFPELQKSQMEMGAKFQRGDGRVHHYFRPDFSSVDELGFNRVDMNQQFVLLVCRDYLWTGDRGYLSRMWPHIVKAMDNIEELDRNGDCLPDHDTKLNTYDGWDFHGTPSYIASLWVSALLAAVRVAEALGEKKRAEKWGDMLETAIASFDRILWNGEYYSLWVEGEERDECCMTDQIDGERFTQVVGLGHCLPTDRISAVLKAIFKYNFRSEDGLINASYPPGIRPTLFTYRNFQAETPWTGIEYVMASMMFEFGSPEDGKTVVKNIHDRYLRAGRFWNHVECGDHYYRAMSSWTVLLSATGFKIDVPKEMLTIAPTSVGEEFRAPWSSSTGWGRFTQTDRYFELRCESGELSFKSLRLNLPKDNLVASINGRKLDSTTGHDVGLVVLQLPQSVTLTAGEVLTVK